VHVSSPPTFIGTKVTKNLQPKRTTLFCCVKRVAGLPILVNKAGFLGAGERFAFYKYLMPGACGPTYLELEELSGSKCAKVAS
jgi:hypothetical protein